MTSHRSDVHSDSRQPRCVAIGATHCTACQSTLYPAQDYGCERCGAHNAALRQVELPARGIISSWAMVHINATRPTPYTVVEVRLDSGPIIRGLLEPGAEPTAGAHVAAVSLEARVDAPKNGPSPILVFAPNRRHG